MDHNILISKLNFYGIRGITLKWFQDYLIHRKQIVKYKTVKSESKTIVCGVPQGSVLGPLLFLLYINDIQQSSNILNFVLFADDTNAFCSNKDLKRLNDVVQNEMIKVKTWLDLNKLSLNVNKTNFILFKASRKKTNHHVEIKIDDQNIKQVENSKFLGVMINEHLSWKTRIDLVMQKVTKTTGIISKIRHYVSQNCLQMIYYALVYPYLTYGNIVWGNTDHSKLGKLVILQKKIIRLMTFSSYNEHSDPIYLKNCKF